MLQVWKFFMRDILGLFYRVQPLAKKHPLFCFQPYKLFPNHL